MSCFFRFCTLCTPVSSYAWMVSCAVSAAELNGTNFVAGRCFVCVDHPLIRRLWPVVLLPPGCPVMRRLMNVKPARYLPRLGALPVSISLMTKYTEGEVTELA